MQTRTYSPSNSSWHTGFLAMLPEIASRARVAFRHLRGQSRDEAVQDVVVNAMLAYRALHRRGKVHRAFPSVLARFAIAQHHAGRRVCGKVNCRDVASKTAQQKGIRVESLSCHDTHGRQWSDILVEDRHAGPAEIAAARIDVYDWFTTLNHRDQQIAKALSEGDETREVAQRFRVTPGRISQKRQQFHESWRTFQGEPTSP